MATVVKTISSIQKRFVDLDFNFGISPNTGDVGKKIDVEAVKQSVRNLLLTKQFERPFQPQLYSQLYDLLFEPFTPTIKITLEEVIFNVLHNYEPRVRILNITVNDKPMNNALDISLTFVVVGVEVPTTYSILLERTR